ncbi:ABC transporter substrate-binding protein [Bacteroidales bacterium AH-315-I05]|nr:ABC transporter substrate-binding protein [Bacteroidales bacterium AH-315-I05]
MFRTVFHLAFILIFLISSCGPSKQAEEEKTVFRYNEPGSITSLDPAYARTIENVWAVNQLFNGLVQLDANLEVQPGIAHKWDISDSGKVYTFYLRDDVFFHDHELFPGGNGRKVTAYDFEYSFYRIIDPSLDSRGKWVFNYLDKSEENNYMGFIAKDERTLKIYLKKPFPPFLGILTTAYCSVVPKEIIEYYELDFRRNPIGTGPFMFKYWEEGTKLVMVRNNNYFERDEKDNQLPYLDAVSVTFVKDHQLAFLDFARGNYDFLSGLEGSFKDQVFTKSGELQAEYTGQFQLQKMPYLKTDYLGILVDDKLDIVKNSSLKIKQVRKAINYGFDREKMIKYLRNNMGVPAYSGFIPRGMQSFDSTAVEGYRYNPEKARELLYAAGFPDGKGLPTITIGTTKDYQDLCEYIQHELGQIGIKLKIDVIQEATFAEMVHQSKLNLFRKSWVADYADSESFLSLFYSKNFCPGGPNYTHFSNYKFDRLYEKAMGETDNKKRYELYHQMDRLIMEEAPVVPLYYDEVVRLVHHNIEGLEINPMNLLVLKNVKKANAKKSGD